MIEKFADLSKIKDLDIKSIRMRALNGDDLVVSAGRCAPVGEGATIDATLFSIMLRQQQIAQSIIEVDGEAIRGPCLQSIKWSARTRNFVGMIFDSLNGVSDEEAASFMTALSKSGSSAEGEAPTASSENG